MLVLSRKEGEQLMVGDNVVITINRISGNRITLGIDAPREVRIVRGELEQTESQAKSSGRRQSPTSGEGSSVAFDVNLAASLDRVAG